MIQLKKILNDTKEMLDDNDPEPWNDSEYKNIDCSEDDVSDEEDSEISLSESEVSDNESYSSSPIFTNIKSQKYKKFKNILNEEDFFPE